MDLSIVIVSYNAGHILKDCLKSVKLASQKLRAETYVVDNNSTDGTAQMVAKNFPWVKLIANTANHGFSKANNQAIKLAKGKYVLILNPDTKVEIDTFTKMIGFMDKHPEAGVATCRLEFPNGRLDPDCRRHFPTPWRAFCHFSTLSKLFIGSAIFDQYNYGYLSSDKEHEVDACAGAFMIIPKKAIDKVGMFDEDFFFYGEDLDWCYRFKEKGYKIIYTPVTRVIHYKGVSSGIKKHSQEISIASRETKIRAYRESTRAMRLFYRKHYKDKYPKVLTNLIFFAIKLLELYRISKV